MRKAFNKIICLLSATIIAVGGGAIPALAADADFNGQGAASVWQYDTVNVRAYGYDAFGDAMKELHPGEVRTVAVRLRNNTADNVEFRLAAEPLTESQAKALEVYYPDKTADDSLLDDIGIDVFHGATRLYEGTLRGLATTGNADMYTASGVTLGQVSAGYSGLVTVDLSVPESLGPEAMDTLCAIEWRFIATQYNDEPVDPPSASDPPNTPNQPSPPDMDNTQGDTPTRDTTPDTGGVAGTDDGDSQGGGAAVGQAQESNVDVPVIDDTLVSELPESGVPFATDSPDVDVDIDATPSPTSAGAAPAGRAWALMNLLLTIVTAVFMIWLLIRYLAGRKPEEGDERSYGREDDRHYGARARRRGAAWLIGILCMAAAIILFILTENMRLPMEIVNRYTIFYVCAVAVEALFFAFSYKNRPDRYRNPT